MLLGSILKWPKHISRKMCKVTFIITALSKLRQEDYFKFKSKLGYIVRTRIAVATLQNPSQKQTRSASLSFLCMNCRDIFPFLLLDTTGRLTSHTQHLQFFIWLLVWLYFIKISTQGVMYFSWYSAWLVCKKPWVLSLAIHVFPTFRKQLGESEIQSNPWLHGKLVKQICIEKNWDPWRPVSWWLSPFQITSLPHTLTSPVYSLQLN